MAFIDQMIALFGLVLTIYIILPIIFKYSPSIQRSLLFRNNANRNEFDLSKPEESGFRCCRTLRLANDIEGQEPHIELGVWHILPESSTASWIKHSDNHTTSILDDLAFADSRPIVLYIHGNGGTRAGLNRSRLYKKLAYEHNYHVVTFDYRGFGDSTYLQPTTDGLTKDAHFMYLWLLRQPHVSKDRVIVWGHSLGAAVSVRMVANLKKSTAPGKLVLEAPFDSLANAIANHSFSTPFRANPYFKYFIVDPIEKSPELNFDSVSCIGEIKSTPIMIIHAEDDKIIPPELGRSLYKRASEILGEARVKFVEIDAVHGLGHNYICTHDETMTKVKQFIEL